MLLALFISVNKTSPVKVQEKKVKEEKKKFTRTSIMFYPLAADTA